MCSRGVVQQDKHQHNMEEEQLKSFLENAGVKREEFVNKLIEEGITLDILLQANENELAILAPNIAEKIKIRTALDQYRNSTTNSPPVLVAVPERQNAVYIVSQNQEIQHGHLEVTNLPSTSSGNSGVTPGPGLTEGNFTVNSLPSLDFSQELELLKNFHLPPQETQKNLRSLLSSETYGRKLLETSGKGSLSPRDRAYIVKLVVETELKSLEKINNIIRKEVWKHWANEISQIFKEENSDLYYVPYHIVGGKIIQASGLIHNRLITHRRALAPEGRKRKSSADCNNSDSSSSGNSDTIPKRVRPLPDGFKVANTKSVRTEDDNDDTDDTDLDWLRNSSSPPETLLAKWKGTFDLRIKLLESLSSCMKYFSLFPGLRLPDGYKLLSSDFEAVHPNANNAFAERFPLIKSRLLQLLTEKAGSTRVDEVKSLVELAAVGEEQANVATFLAIITLLRQMPTICIPRKKVWKLSREEVRSSFLGRVSTASDIERYCIDREALVALKGIPQQPYILAVGSCWADVSQYEIVIHRGLRYQLEDICTAIKHIYHMYWALDCAYPKDSAPCWMFVQRTMFQMRSKYDTEGIPLRELLCKMNV